MDRRKSNSLRYTYEITRMEEREEELKSLLMRVKEESEKAGLKLNIKTLRSWSPITSWQIDGENVETVADFIFLGSRISADNDCNHKIKGPSLEEKL